MNANTHGQPRQHPGPYQPRPRDPSPRTPVATAYMIIGATVFLVSLVMSVMSVVAVAQAPHGGSYLPLTAMTIGGGLFFYGVFIRRGRRAADDQRPPETSSDAPVT